MENLNLKPLAMIWKRRQTERNPILAIELANLLEDFVKKNCLLLSSLVQVGWMGSTMDKDSDILEKMIAGISMQDTDTKARNWGTSR